MLSCFVITPHIRRICKHWYFMADHSDKRHSGLNIRKSLNIRSKQSLNFRGYWLATKRKLKESMFLRTVFAFNLHRIRELMAGFQWKKPMGIEVFLDLSWNASHQEKPSCSNHSVWHSKAPTQTLELLDQSQRLEWKGSQRKQWNIFNNGGGLVTDSYTKRTR